MAGVKGKSGRKSHLEDKTAEEILNLSAFTIRKALSPKTPGGEDYELSLSVRADLASKIYTKAMPQHVEGDFNHKVTEMPAIQKDVPSGEANGKPQNRVAEYLIGSPDSTEDTGHTG